MPKKFKAEKNKINAFDEDKKESILENQEINDNIKKVEKDLSLMEYKPKFEIPLLAQASIHNY